MIMIQLTVLEFYNWLPSQSPSDIARPLQSTDDCAWAKNCRRDTRRSRPTPRTRPAVHAIVAPAVSARPPVRSPSARRVVVFEFV